MAKMVPIERSKADKKAADKEMRASPGDGGPDYPYGTRVELNHDTLKKIGLHDGEMPKTGTEVNLRAKGHISSTTDNQRDGGSDRRIEVQLTHLPHRLGIGDEDEATAGGKQAGSERNVSGGIRGDLEAALEQTKGR